MHCVLPGFAQFWLSYCLVLNFQRDVYLLSQLATPTMADISSQVSEDIAKILQSATVNDIVFEQPVVLLSSSSSVHEALTVLTEYAVAFLTSLLTTQQSNPVSTSV